MDHWTTFLNSLSTRGGAIFLLVLVNILGGCLILHLIHHHEAEGALGASIMTTFGNFTGALLIVLKGSSEKADKP